MIRILHTSDWHLGATLGELPRLEEQRAFLDWLVGLLGERAVDVLVVAGDVFDQAQPSAEAQRLYYQFLCACRETGLRKVVVVGGNHDSASRLDAPREVLGCLDVHVVGGLAADPADWSRCVCTVAGRQGGVDAIVLAVPYVHEIRLGVRVAAADRAEIQRSFAVKFRELYGRLAGEAEAAGLGAPIVATGHLVAGDFGGDDDHGDIHLVGSIGGLPTDIFDPRVRYVALGHLHRAHPVPGSAAWYSGTPIALNRVEGRSARKVLLVELPPDGAPAVTPIPVPQQRAVLETRGTLAEVADRLRALASDAPLPPFVHVTVEGDRYDAEVDRVIREVLDARGDAAPRLAGPIEQKLRAGTAAAGGSPKVESLDELGPEEVFRRLCAEKGEPLDDELLDAFRSLLAQAGEGEPR